MSAPTTLVMPKLGLTMEEGRIAQWLVAPGSRFASGDALAVIETDKIASDVEAPGAGVLVEILAAEGAQVPVSTPIARLQLDEASARVASLPSDDDGRPAPTAFEAGSGRAQPPPPVVAPSRDRSLATPYARRLARESGVVLAALTGSGPHGRIKAVDVLRAKSRDAPVVPIAQPTTPLRDLPAVPARTYPAGAQSLAQIEIDVTRLRDVEASLGGDAATLRVDLIAMAAARACPELTADTTPSIGLALPTARGTTIGIIQCPLRAGLSAFRDAMAQARQNSRAPQGGSGALLVAYGGAATTTYAPAVPIGSSACLGIAAERIGVRLTPGRHVEDYRMIRLSLSYDAAAVTDAAALAFLSALKQLLEEPLGMLAG